MLEGDGALDDLHHLLLRALDVVERAECLERFQAQGQAVLVLGVLYVLDHTFTAGVRAAADQYIDDDVHAQLQHYSAALLLLWFHFAQCTHGCLLR